MDGLPPRRTAASASGAQTDRRGPPPSSFRSSQRPDAARASTNESKAAKLLSSITVREMDRMTDAQLGQVVEILGGARGSSLASVPLKANWQLLRRTFNDEEMHAAMLKKTSDVLEVLLKPAKAEPQRPNARPQGPQGAQGPQGSQGPRPSSQRPALRPISIVGMDKATAFKGLAARGMNRQQLEQMKTDVFDHIKHGNRTTGDALNEKYKAFVTDDFSSSAVYSSYAKLLGNLSGF
ncbi:hypothetical protein ASC87_18185 [Rhizobacter sp. Root1221]|nr:hypothetical protein ASC87_18185 [Rhizobacter sp. Root1221]